METTLDRQIDGTWQEVPVGRIGERFGRLRLVDPKADRRMTESVRRYGQLAPVVLGVMEGGAYELVDGFKRLRACRELGRPGLKARLLTGNVRGLKAAMVTLNWNSRSMGELEEALVLASLHREDGLTQVEIGVLAGRHKSWVCRRIALASRLGEEVVEHLRLGLIRAGVGRELARLPRGNQAAVLTAVLEHRLTTRETARLVGDVLSNPKWAQEKILRFPEGILDDRVPPRPTSAGGGPAGRLCRALADLDRRGRQAARLLAARGKEHGWSAEEVAAALGAASNLAGVVEAIRSALPGGEPF